MSRKESRTKSDAGPASGRERLFPWLLVIIAAAVFANSLRGPFIYDDAVSIVQNPQVRQLWPPGSALWAPAQTPTAGRPVPALTLAVNYALGGLNVVGYHVVNVGLHAVNAVLLFLLFRSILCGPRLGPRFRDAAGGLAFTAALIWMVHPLVTETVDYITQRTGSIVAMFYLATLYAAIRARAGGARGWAIAAVVLCALGMASKESMVTAPLVVVLLDWVFWSRPGDETRTRYRWGLYAGLAGTWLVLVGLNLAGPRSGTVGFATGVGSVEYLLNQCFVLVDYLRLVVWPHPLVIDYGYPRPLTFGDAAPRAIFLALLGVTAVVTLVRRQPVGFALAFVFIVLGPTSSVVPIASEVGAERRMYLPLAAIVALGVVSAYATIRRFAGANVWLGPGLTLLIAAALAAGTVRRNAEYRTELKVWESAVAARPGNPRAHNNLANVLEENGRLEDAVAHHRRAVELRSGVIVGLRERAAGHFNLGRVLQVSGETDAAIAQYEEAVRLAPHHRAHHNLGTVLHGLGRTTEGISYLRQAVEIDSASVDSLSNLGFALLQTGDMAGAIPHLERAAELEPDLPLVHFNLAGAYRSVGEPAAAVPHYLTAGRLTHDDAAMQAVVGYALDDLGHAAEAIGFLQRAVSVAPDDVGAFERLGGALVRAGRIDEGIAQLQRTIQRWPQRPLAWAEATRVLAEHPDPGRRNPPEAIRLGERVVEMTGGRESNALAALAAAYASAGRTDDAVAAAERGLAIAEAGPDAGITQRIRAELERYRRGPTK